MLQSAVRSTTTAAKTRVEYLLYETSAPAMRSHFVTGVEVLTRAASSRCRRTASAAVTFQGCRVWICMGLPPVFAACGLARFCQRRPARPQAAETTVNLEQQGPTRYTSPPT